ncbi:MAG: AAA family ATPase, partial [Nocardioides sp.]
MGPLLERAGHVASLERWRSEAAAGSGSLVLISGAAGNGKTALVEQVSGPSVLRGWCDPLSTPRPLGPLLDIAAQTGSALLDVVRGLSDPVQVYQVFVATLVESARERAPAVVILEDLHWADEATAELVTFLARRVASMPALVLATFRPDDLGDAHPLKQTLAQVAGLPAVHRLAVSPLSLSAVEELASARGLDAEELHRTTGGNAFFVQEILAAGGGLPSTVQDAVLGRLLRLSERERALAEAVSADPHGLPLELVEPLLGIPAQTVDAVGLLVVARSAIQFHHEVARQAVYDAVPPVRRARLHRDLVGLLQSRGPAEITRVAHHAIASAEPDLISLHAGAAGGAALQRGSAREAADLFTVALDATRGVEDGRAARLLQGLSEALSRSGSIEASR